MSQMTQAEAEAFISLTLQQLVGRGVDSANFNIAITAPGGVSLQPHRKNVIGSSGRFDGDTQPIVVKSASSNKVKQPGGPATYVAPKPEALPVVAAPEPAPPAA